MDKSFHYYGTYCAAYLAGYTHEECLDICYSAQLVDCCSRTFLKTVGGPLAAATTQLSAEMLEVRKDILGLQDITRIWASFHFLPYDLLADPKKGGRRYRNKYRLICGPNGELVTRTVELAQGKGPQAVGLAMHVLADTWAHRYFGGTPSLVINNTNRHFVELVARDGELVERPVTFKHNASMLDDLDQGVYVNTLLQASENSVMSLGHGRAGHLPDYSFARYRYLPAWDDYEETVKDNPSDFYHAFCQMVYALACLRDARGPFAVDSYDFEAAAPWEGEIKRILEKRQLDSCDDWRALGERMSGRDIEDFDLGRHVEAYQSATGTAKDETYLGRFFIAAMAQKSMVTNAIYRSGNPLAGHSIDFNEKGFGGIKDYLVLIQHMRGGAA